MTIQVRSPFTPFIYVFQTITHLFWIDLDMNSSVNSDERAQVTDELEVKKRKQVDTFKHRMSLKRQKLINYLPEKPAMYYKNLPFMPGLDFYRVVGETYFNINNFGTSIPDTMVSIGKLVWIQWDPNPSDLEGTNKRRENDFVLLNFADHIRNIDTTLYSRDPVESDNPVVVEKKFTNSYFSASERTLSWGSLLNIINSAVNVNSILQKFNYSRSKKS